MKRTKEEAQQTRDDLLKAALKVFGEKGYVATRLEDIAREAKVTRGALYWHFKGKDDLFLELIKHSTSPFFQILLEIAETQLAPLKKIRRILQGLLHHIETNQNVRNTLLLDYERVTTSEHSREFNRVMNENSIKHAGIMSEIIEAGKKSGTIRTDYSTEDIMAYVATLITGAVLNARIRTQFDQSRFVINVNTIPDLAIEAIKTG